MEIEEILNILPHRYPFLLVDRILELQPGQRAVGIKCVSYNEPFFQGHFPGYPIMPAALIVEAMAQVGGVLLLSMVENKGKLAVFTGIDRTKFRRPVKPGDTLVMEAETIKIKGPMGKIRVSATVEGSRVAEGEFMFAMVEHPGTQTGDHRNLILATPLFR